jgi:hypothetical protein
LIRPGLAVMPNLKYCGQKVIAGNTNAIADKKVFIESHNGSTIHFSTLFSIQVLKNVLRALKKVLVGHHWSRPNYVF